jgi:hypothetical protein
VCTVKPFKLWWVLIRRGGIGSMLKKDGDVCVCDVVEFNHYYKKMDHQVSRVNKWLDVGGF